MGEQEGLQYTQSSIHSPAVHPFTKLTTEPEQSAPFFGAHTAYRKVDKITLHRAEELRDDVRAAIKGTF